MRISLDNVVSILRLTVWQPSFYVCILAWLLTQGRSKGIAIVSISTQLAAALLTLVSICHLSSFASRKHRNGWARTRRLDAKTWVKETVVVTGASGGVGRALSSLLQSKGAKVIEWDIVPATGSAHFYRCDVSDAEQVNLHAARVVKEHGPVTMLINNAGVLNGKLLVDLDEEDIKRIIGVNLASHLYCLKAFLPDMIASNSGHIVTVSSVMGHIGIAQVGDYVATKHALVGLHESLRYELDKKYKAPRVRTTLVCPGHIRTPLFAEIDIPPLARFLAPHLEPETVARAIIDALERRESMDIYLPWYAQWTPLFRILPSFLRDLAQYISGADEAIEGMYRRRARVTVQGDAAQ